MTSKWSRADSTSPLRRHERSSDIRVTTTTSSTWRRRSASSIARTVSEALGLVARSRRGTNSTSAPAPNRLARGDLISAVSISACRDHENSFAHAYVVPGPGSPEPALKSSPRVTAVSEAGVVKPSPRTTRSYEGDRPTCCPRASSSSRTGRLQRFSYLGGRGFVDYPRPRWARRGGARRADRAAGSLLLGAGRAVRVEAPRPRPACRPARAAPRGRVRARGSETVLIGVADEIAGEPRFRRACRCGRSRARERPRPDRRARADGVGARTPGRRRSSRRSWRRIRTAWRGRRRGRRPVVCAAWVRFEAERSSRRSGAARPCRPGAAAGSTARRSPTVRPRRGARISLARGRRVGRQPPDPRAARLRRGHHDDAVRLVAFLKPAIGRLGVRS